MLKGYGGEPLKEELSYSHREWFGLTEVANAETKFSGRLDWV